MLKKILLGILMSSSLFSQRLLGNFFKYSTAYASFSLNAPRYQDDRFSIIGGLSTGALEVARDERELKRFQRRTENYDILENEGVCELEPDLGKKFNKGLFFIYEAHLSPRDSLS